MNFALNLGEVLKDLERGPVLSLLVDDFFVST